MLEVSFPELFPYLAPGIARGGEISSGSTHIVIRCGSFLCFREVLSGGGANEDAMLVHEFGFSVVVCWGWLEGVVIANNLMGRLALIPQTKHWCLVQNICALGIVVLRAG
jgi:hypothetical protein